MATVSKASVLIPVAIALVGALIALEVLRDQGAKHDAAEQAAAGAGAAIVRKIGEPLPDLVFHSLDGKAVKLSDLKSKVVLINFWATWCGPCVKEMPSLQKLAAEYEKRGLSVVGVNVDDNPEDVLAPFLSKHGIKFTSFVDPKGELADKIGISGLPLTLVVDGNRKLLFEHLGDEEWFDADYRKQFELWLAGTNPG
ncbi:MAG: TlpA family protein disulfide reductase [Bdellovibrionales bacterium]|nr:TlpA family protein disulfide reductase [Bdellovibrionales bacterium]